MHVCSHYTPLVLIIISDIPISSITHALKEAGDFGNFKSLAQNTNRPATLYTFVPAFRLVYPWPCRPVRRRPEVPCYTKTAPDTL